NGNLDVTRNFQIHLTYLSRRLTQIKYYNRGKYIQTTSLNYDAESIAPNLGSLKNFRNLEIVDHNTKEHLKYNFSGLMVRGITKAIDEDYKYQSNLDISYQGNTVTVVNDRKQKMLCGFRNDGSLEFESDNLGTASGFVFNSNEELLMQSAPVLTNQFNNPDYNLHNDPSFSGHARAVLVNGPFGRGNVTQVWQESTLNYILPRTAFKPLTLSVWGRRNPQVVSRNHSGEVRLTAKTIEGVLITKTITFTEAEWTFKTIQIIPEQVYGNFELFVRNMDNYGFHYMIIVTQEAMPFQNFDKENRPNYQTRKEMTNRSGTFYNIRRNEFNQVTNATSIHGDMVTNEYDNFNNLTRSQTALAGGSFLNSGASFTSNGRRLASETSFSGAITEYSYSNSQEDLSEIRHPDGSATNFGLDSNFRTIEMTQRRGAESNSHFFEYNSDDNIGSVRAQDAKSYNYLYGNSLEFKGVEAVNPANNLRNSFTAFAYNKDGEVKEKAYGTKDKFLFRYNQDGRIANVIYEDQNKVENVVAFYQYDDQNLNMKVTDEHRTYSHNFDFNGNQVSLTDNEGNKIETVFDNGNFSARAYEIDNQKRLFILDNFAGQKADNQILEHLQQLRGMAFADFRFNRILRFRDDADNIRNLNPDRSTNIGIGRDKVINFFNVSSPWGNNYNLTAPFIINNQSISFWFRVESLPTGRHSLFQTGNDARFNRVEVLAQGSQLQLQITRNNNTETIISLTGIMAGQWNYLAVSWTQNEARLFLNNQEGHRAITPLNLEAVLRFVHNAPATTSLSTDIAHIITSVRGAFDAESLRLFYHFTKGLFTERTLPDNVSALNTVSHFLAQPNHLSNYHFMPLNNTLNGIEGEQPLRVSAESRSFIFDFDIGRSVYQAMGNHLEYQFPANTNQGTISLRFCVVEDTPRQTIIHATGTSAVAGRSSFQVVRNANRRLTLNIDGTDLESTLTILDNRWYTVLCSWTRRTQNIYTFDLSLDNQQQSFANHAFLDFTDLSIALGATSTSPRVNQLVGRISTFLMTKASVTAPLHIFTRSVMIETTKQTEIDSTGLAAKETVTEGGRAILTKTCAHDTRQEGGQNRLSGFLGNEMLTYNNGSMTFRYQYDNLGNINRIEGDEDRTYNYDYRNYLTSERNSQSTVNYHYHSNGNIQRAVMTMSNTNSIEKSFGYNDARSRDLLTNVTDFSGNTIVIEYDNSYMGIPKSRLVRDRIGNTTSNISYQYQARRLVRMHDSHKNESLEFTYDSQNLRIGKKYVDNSTSYEVKYYYDGDRLITESGDNYRLDFHYDENGLLFGLTDTVGVTSRQFYYLRDNTLNIIGLLNSQGQLVCSYRYEDAWGKHVTLNANGTIDTNQNSIGNVNPMRFKGYYFDRETGLYYLVSRFYDSELMRFISADDIRFINPSLISGLNLFAYCLNNPIMNFDPSGNFAISITLGIVGLVKLAQHTGILGVNVSRTETTMQSYLGVYQMETGTSTGISSGRPININFSAPRRLWRFWEYSIGLDVNINGRGGGVNFGSQGSLVVHTGNGNSHAVGGNWLGRAFYQRSWKDEFGNSHFVRHSINLPESILALKALKVVIPILISGYRSVGKALNVIGQHFGFATGGTGAIVAIIAFLRELLNRGDHIDSY
ncbi:MAG: hypothetical protein FWE36_06595, partial [Erysipelotrichales bacterium]|nr:hypothetical protein [Erysipelotrichales bacterium]